MTEYFQLIQDDDCHWYLIPSEKADAWEGWLKSSAYIDGVLPYYAKRINGPHSIEFSNYREL